MRLFSRQTMGRLWPRLFAVAAIALAASWARATSVIPIADAELQARADVVVYGVVSSSEATVDGDGRPEMLTFVEPTEILKGRLSGPLILHQLGATLPDGRFLKIWGAPEYAPGEEVVVFAIARPGGEYQTAELMLGKFAVAQDPAGATFAVPGLQAGSRDGVSIFPPPARVGEGSRRERVGEAVDSQSPPRPLLDFLSQVRTGHFRALAGPRPAGALAPVMHSVKGGRTSTWANWAPGTNYRWSNGATAQWTTVNTANITGGGAAEALAALAAWTNDPNSTINYTMGPSNSPNTIDLNATSVCGQSGCLSGSGVIGCGGPSGGGSNAWRGDNYTTIGGGFVQLRSYCTTNLYDSITTQAVIEHELGHTLGFGHSDQGISPHDSCRGDEDAAIMRSVVQHRVSLGTDDQDAIRWVYGDGLTSCSAAGPPAPAGLTPSFGPVAGGTVVTIIGSGFAPGATVTFGGAAGTAVSVTSSSSLTVTTPANSAGPVNVVVTNPDLQTGSLASGFTYSTGASFYTLAPCRLLDTRNPQGPLGGPAIAANTDRAFVLTGHCGIPSTARELSVNLTVTQSSSSGDLRLSASGGAIPVTSSINYRGGQTRANNLMVGLGPTGSINVHCDQGSGSVHVILDVNGYLQ